MPNPKLETYKNKATNTVYDLTDADAQSKLTAILDGSSIDSFGDVESALADKVSKSNTAGLLKNDGTVDTTQYVSDISGKVDFADIAPAFSTSTSYTIGQLVTYNGNLYRFIHNHSAGAWDSNDVAQTTIRQDLEHKEDSVTYNSDDFEHVIVIDDGEPYVTNLVSLNRSNIFPRDEQSVLGAKNLLNNTATTQTINGVTYTVNADKTVSLSNTATANARLLVGSFTAKAGETYILTGAPNSADTSNYLGLYLHGDTQSVTSDTGDGAVITTDTDTLYDVGIRIKSGKDTSGMVFKPMIRLATDPDSTYVPHAMTNRELTEKVTPVDYVPTYEGNFAPNSATSFEYKKVGDIKVINAYIKGDSVTANTWTTLCTLPTEMKPTIGEVQLFGKVNGGEVVDCNVSSAGAIRIKSVSALTATSIIKVSGVYI